MEIGAGAAGSRKGSRAVDTHTRGHDSTECNLCVQSSEECPTALRNQKLDFQKIGSTIMRL